MANHLEWTGERLVTQLTSGFGTFEHLHRYALALQLCKNRRVLDIASGEGYGTNLIAGVAEFVFGVDISLEAIEHSNNKYQRNNLQFKCGSTSSIPLESNSVEVVVSFETIEHILEQGLFLSEIKRVLKKNGILIISTPDKDNYGIRDPNNQFHVKELTTEEFSDLLGRYFNNIQLYGQRIFIGSIISCMQDFNGEYSLYDGDFSEIRTSFDEHEIFNRKYFNLIVATDEEGMNNCISSISLFSAYKTYQNEHEKLIEQMRDNNQKLKSLLSSRTYIFCLWLKKNIIDLPSRLLSTIKEAI